jgi:Rap1a immunity proteins
MRDRIGTMAGAMLLNLSLSLGVHAQNLTVSKYQHPRSPQDLTYNKAYLMGIADGLIAYNVTVDNKRFCIPGLMPHLTFDQANDIMLRWARTASGGADLPVARALYFGLTKAYPCR